ncbi:uncharacterized protein LOC133815107 [Humulus lupulus]|uniref:uncharacterized protein LOC133815107 n=1 Tax=Humulus lupulus TaxID=3486 RepID=UPI002B407CE3|nr:uncharacterized protein LOC133815107 [Humulus lupulus]
MSYKQWKQLTCTTKYSYISEWRFYRAKKEAMKILEGSVRDQFVIVEDYCKQILATNPGSTTLLKTTMRGGKRYFERVYICLKACKDGFIKGCRPLIGLDGCFLKGYCKGVLLAAVGVDGENSLYPIAYAIVEKENTETWKWFVEILKEDLQVENSSKFTLMSDRPKGLENAMKSLWDGAHVRYCVRHMHSNFKKDFPGLLLKQLLWAAARASTKEEFVKCMKTIKDVNESAYNWLMAKNASEWTRSHFDDSVKCDMVLNNMCESFNSAILEARDKAVVTLLEKIRFWLMVRFCQKRESVNKWRDGISKQIWDLLEKNKEVAKKCHTNRANAFNFQVTHETDGSFVVDLIALTCTCRKFELNGLPCSHAVAAIWKRGLNVLDYVHDYYKKESFIHVYEGVVQPMPSPNKWPSSSNAPILPPPEYKLPGRPKKSRKREVDEPPVGATKSNRHG